MHTENTPINCRCQWQEVEQVCELLPDNETAVFALALDLKAVDLRDLARFVISAQQEEPVRVSEFEQDQVCDSFYRSCTSIHVVAQEKIVCVGHFASDSKEFDYVKKLTVNVAYDGYWRGH